MGIDESGATDALDTFKVTLGQIDDPNVALVTYVTVLEELVRRVAADKGIQLEGPVTSVLSALQERGIVREPASDAMKGLVELRNQAAHGARVAPGIVKVLKGEGIQVLDQLNELSRQPA